MALYLQAQQDNEWVFHNSCFFDNQNVHMVCSIL